MRAFRKGSTLIEVAVVIFVIGFGLTSVYLILSRGMKLAETTSNRIAAINLAREGIEAVTNARDTNWVKFAADFPSCWKVQNYDKTCVGAAPATAAALSFGGGVDAELVPFLSGGLWYFTGATANSGVYVDAQGLPFQTGAAAPAGFSAPCQFVDPNATSCHSNMRRVLRLGHPSVLDATPAPAWCFNGTGCLSVTSDVEWYDQASQRVHTVSLSTVLTDWRNNF